MADYYPLIARALEGLPETGEEARRSVYDRARAALDSQLRSLDPPLGEPEIARELASLDDAIGRAERNYAASGATADGAAERERLPEIVPDPGLRPRLDKPPEIRRGGRRGRSLVTSIALVVVIAPIAVAAWLLRDREPQTAPAQDTPRTAAPVPAPASQGEPKFPERVGRGPAPAAPAPSPPPSRPAPAGPSGASPVAPSPAAPPPAVSAGPTPEPSAPPAPVAGESPAAPPASSGSQDVSVAQPAMLAEENTGDTAQPPKTTRGRVLWRLDTVNPGPGQPLDTVVRASVDVPEADLSLTLEMRRNRETTFPASHTIDLSFTTRAGDPGRAVRDVGLPALGTDETSRGTPLAGLPVPVKENRFLIGLSDLPADIGRNTELMTQRDWVQLQLRFASGQRAVLVFEKGVAGDKVVADAFRLWAQP